MNDLTGASGRRGSCPRKIRGRPDPADLGHLLVRRGDRRRRPPDTKGGTSWYRLDDISERPKQLLGPIADAATQVAVFGVRRHVGDDIVPRHVASPHSEAERITELQPEEQVDRGDVARKVVSNVGVVRRDMNIDRYATTGSARRTPTRFGARSRVPPAAAPAGSPVLCGLGLPRGRATRKTFHG